MKNTITFAIVTVAIAALVITFSSLNNGIQTVFAQGPPSSFPGQGQSQEPPNGFPPNANPQGPPYLVPPEDVPPGPPDNFPPRPRG